MKNTFTLLSLYIVCIFPLFLSCNDNQIMSDFDLRDSDVMIEINQKQIDDIQKMADFVKNIQSTSRSSLLRDTTIDDGNHRIYMTWWWCTGTGGNCLDDLIVPSQAGTTPLDLFYRTKVGKGLANDVTAKNLDLTIHDNKQTNTIFLIYSNPNNPNKSMVIPLVSKE